MESIIQSSVANSITYENYRNTIDTLLKEGKSTGHEQSEALTHYSELNVTRMNRLDKTMTVAAEFAEQLKELKGDYFWLVISEGWCGDAAQLVPIFHKMAELSPNIEMKIALRDDNDALMATSLLKSGFRTDVEPILAMARLESGGAIDPVATYRVSGYRARVAEIRPKSSGAGGGIV